MVPKKIKMVRTEKDKQKEYVLRRFEDKDIHRIFMAWNNPQSYRYNSVDWNEASVSELVHTSWPSKWGMYFMVLEDVSTGEILGTCRFGGNPESNYKTWGFGYCVFRGDDKEKYTLDDIREVFKNGTRKDDLCWGKGYASLMVEKIIEIAQAEGVSQIISGADARNWGSQKVMLKNGMTFHEFDKDYDVDLIIRLKNDNGEILPIEIPSKEQLKTVWDKHVTLVNEKLSEEIVKIKMAENEEAHKGNCYMFLLLNRASMIQSANENISDLKSDIRDNYLKFTEEEKRLFLNSFAKYKDKLQKRLNDANFDQQDVLYNLSCCKILDAELSKININLA